MNLNVEEHYNVLLVGNLVIPVEYDQKIINDSRFTKNVKIISWSSFQLNFNECLIDVTIVNYNRRFRVSLVNSSLIPQKDIKSDDLPLFNAMEANIVSKGVDELTVKVAKALFDWIFIVTDNLLVI
ncbi:hypothetical protein RF11_01024 [Thelohanellus kitauei]|uniref:Uncharacterized protein n=1 Tax=Thelohanellus kitauei TaxID=669202 RepID=A0A0C2J689_THEKT|nr:hypothetical protein RF11_01024 [Thelohanellus kitauei]